MIFTNLFKWQLLDICEECVEPNLQHMIVPMEHFDHSFLQGSYNIGTSHFKFPKFSALDDYYGTFWYCFSVILSVFMLLAPNVANFLYEMSICKILHSCHSFEEYLG
jgi:hypothetical protein